MFIKNSCAVTALLTGVMLCAAGGASAQLFNRPPASVQNGGGSDAAALMLRIERLENQVRSLTGQLEEAQFRNRRLEDQLRNLQTAGAAPGDQATRGGSTRFEPEGPRRRGSFEAPPSVNGPMPLPSSGVNARGRGDAFDPTQKPNAPGAPRVLGGLDARTGLPPHLSGPLGDPIIDEGPYRDDPSAPLDLLNPRRSQGVSSARAPESSPLPAPSASPLPAPAPLEPARPALRTQTATPVDPSPNMPASTLPPPGPREVYESSNVALRAGDLDRAEAGYKDLLKRFPTSRLASEATFNLGDVYARRGRHREAAEQFLKVTTDFSDSSQAPRSLHRLGQSLERLGAKEQACAAWAEVPRKYPSAPQSVRAAAERDIKRASC